MFEIKAKLSVWFLVIGRLQSRCGDALFLLVLTSEIHTYIRGNWVAKRGLTNRANIHYPYVKKWFKTQHGIIPIDPAILAAIGHRFIAKKYADARV